MLRFRKLSFVFKIVNRFSKLVENRQQNQDLRQPEEKGGKKGGNVEKRGGRLEKGGKGGKAGNRGERLI
jgi:hypothetical protein